MARKYEGSREDEREDRKGARRLGVSLKSYERTAQDKRQDKAGQKRLTEKKR